MTDKKKAYLPSPITILMIVIIIAALCTYLIPAGQYNTLTHAEKETSFHLISPAGDSSLPFTQATLDQLKIKIPLEKFANGSIRKPVAVPGSYRRLPPSKQGWLQVLEAPVKGLTDAVDIVLFLLIIGGFMNVFHETGAMERGLKSLSYKMKGKEARLLIIISFLLAFGGASYGMAEEAFVFYAVLVPVFVAAGYDLLIPVAVIFGGTSIGNLASFTNPFATIIASNAAGINWADGLWERVIVFVILTAIFIWYVVRYAERVKKDPTKSLLYVAPGNHSTGVFPEINAPLQDPGPLGTKARVLLFLFLGTFLTMIVGVVWFDWWLTEMSTLFLSAAMLFAVVARVREDRFVKQFVKGAESLLGVSLIVGVARGVTIILNEGKISDSIVFYAAKAVSTLPPSLFIIMMLFVFILFTFFISSSSGMAVLTMPIMGSLAIMVNVPGREIVNAYLFGMGIMGFITPTGLILPSLAMVDVSIKAWWKFIWPLLLILIVVCLACLLIGIRFA